MFFSIDKMLKDIIFATSRLYFKPFSKDDIQNFFDLNNDFEVIKYTGDIAFENIKETEDFINNYSHYEQYGYGRWSVYTKEKNEYIGFCGLKYSEEKKEVDLGFRFKRNQWNKGYATEASNGCLEFAKSINIKTVVARANKLNIASIKVIQKLGMNKTFSFIENKQEWIQFEITLK